MTIKLPKARRQDYIYQALRGKSEEHALSIQEISDVLATNGIQVNTRTIRRDLEDLSNNHGLCDNDSYPLKFFISPDFEFKHKLHLNEETLQVLMIALNNLKETSHNYFEGLASEAEIAILNSLPTETVTQTLKDKETYHFDCSPSGKPTEDNAKDLKQILKALRAKKIFTCKNNSPYKDEKYNNQIRSFAPLKLIMNSGTAYLAVKDIRDKNIKKIRVSRLSEIVVTQNHFSEEVTLNLAQAIGGWGGISESPLNMSFNCNRIMATYFEEKQLHKTQKISQETDGSFTISLTCAYSSELARILSSFGGNLNAARPKVLWDDILNIWSSGLKNDAA